MKRLNKWYSLKKELFIYFLITSTIMFILLGIVFLVVSNKVIQKHVQTDQRLILENQIQLMDSNLSLFENLINSIATNVDLISILSRSESQEYAFDDTVKNFYNVLNLQMLPIKRYISIIHIQGNNGFTVRKGFESYLIDKEDYVNTTWYKESCESTGKILWYGMQKNYTDIPHVEVAASSDYIVPIYKKLCRPRDLEILGDVIIFLSPSLFLGEGYFHEYSKNSESIIVDANGSVVYTSNYDLLEENVNVSEMIDFDIRKATTSKVYEIYENNKLIMFKKSSQTNLYLVRIIEMDSILKEESYFKYIIISIIAIIMIISVALSIWFSGYFSKPIEKIILKINRIAQGDFQYKIEMSEGVEKFEVLYNNLHKMEVNIQEMMEDNIRKEKEKRTLEIQMLQMQINPHFLYNTLNSIKWMAALQGVYGIETMVTSLGIVLEASFNKTDEFVTIKEELEVLNHYFNIQQIRYQDKISLHITCSDPVLYERYVPRFILQPIVENSIFHGIAPKGSPGTINISIEEKDKVICIIIKDNGMGMTRDKVRNILKESDHIINHRGVKGIGLSNVNSRIQLIYGSDYGLVVDSVEGEYTSVTVNIPIQQEKQNESISS